ncbi:MAG TPA: GatB/YqeY domain-containing protein [Armatimonadetes bacterium]|nr:GatB/YqeY domain-containing protein [Armatimonadota bacterium]
MGLKERLLEELKEAMRAKDDLKVSVIRMLRAAVVNAEKEKRRELSEDEVLEVISREVKRRVEAAEEYERAGRADLAEKERKEAEILRSYLPEQMSEEEIKELARRVIEEVGAVGRKDMGKVMGSIMPRVRGRAEGRVVSEIVRRLLEEMEG